MQETFAALRDLVLAGEDLTADQMQAAVGQIMTGGCSDLEISTFLTALASKGESVAELAGAAAAMRQHDPHREPPSTFAGYLRHGGWRKHDLQHQYDRCPGDCRRRGSRREAWQSQRDQQEWFGRCVGWLGGEYRSECAPSGEVSGRVGDLLLFCSAHAPRDEACGIRPKAVGNSDNF